jgi:YidC/Oxa1 family membrane protein insertase
MTANQRLMLAVVMSILFFVAYTAIFPPKENVQDANSTQNTPTTQVKMDVNVEEATNHTIATSEKITTGSSNTLVTVAHKDFILKIDTLGRISSKVLLEEKFNDGNDEHAELIPTTGTKPLLVRFMDEELNKEALSTPYSTSVSNVVLEENGQKITLTQKLSSLTVTKELIFYPDGHYDAAINVSQDKRYFVYLGQRPQIKEQMMTVSGAMIYTGDDIATIIEDGDAEGRKTFSDVTLISAFDQYTATIMYGFAKDTAIIVERDRNDNPVIYFDALPMMNFHGYIGPKEYKTLKTIEPSLVNAIEYGWFTFAAKPLFALLSWLHGIFGNWGWAIIGLTIIIRLVLYPLTYKGMVSMQKIKEIAPRIKEVQAKYKGDPQRMNAAVMEMYKKHGANPLGGCLPMLLQIPVFFAIYRVLLNAVELQGAEWALWINDLSRMDPTFILPILMGATMYFQQRITPNNFTDPLQEKIFKFLPIIFTFFFLTFPSGLVLYWFVNNLFSIAQQYIVNVQFQKGKEAQVALHKHAEKKDDQD